MLNDNNLLSWVLVIAILFFVYGGSPDLHDSVIHLLSGGVE